VKLFFMRHNCRSYIALALVLFLVSFQARAVVTIHVTATTGVPLPINLTTTLESYIAPDITLITFPAGGIVAKTSATTLEYTPNPGFVGSDFFEYTVLDSNNLPEVGVVNILVGSLENAGYTVYDAIGHMLDDICNQDPRPSNACAEWTVIQNLPVEDRREVLGKLAPDQLAAQLQQGSELVLDQLESVSRRLATLRKAMKYSSSGALTFKHYDDGIPDVYGEGSPKIANLVTSQSGGAASGDSFLSRSRMSWYIDNSNRGGSQNPTLREEGFDFLSQNFNGGLDLTFGSAGVAGIAFGYGKSELDLSFNSGELLSSGFSNSLYGSFYMTPGSYFDVVINNAFINLESNRNANFGSIVDVAVGKTDSWMTALTLAVGVEANLGPLTMSIEKTFNYVKTTIAAYAESSANLSNPLVFGFDEHINEQAKSVLTSRFSYAQGFPWGAVNHQLDFSYHYLYKGDGERFSGYLVAAPEAGSFVFSSDAEDMNYAQIGYGANLLFPGGTMVYLRVDTTQLRNNYRDIGSALGLRMEF